VGELNTGVDYSMFTERLDVFMGMGPSYFRKPWVGGLQIFEPAEIGA